MKFTNLIAAAFAVIASGCAHSEQSTIAATHLTDINVKFLDASAAPAQAKLDRLAWMSGLWQSDATPISFSGGGEHVILSAYDGQMPGLVRVRDREGGYMLFELSSFMQIDETLTYRNRHFAPDLTAWQAPGDYIDRPLVAIDTETAWFDGITFKRLGPDRMGVSFILTDENGTQTQYYIDYKKASL